MACFQLYGPRYGPLVRCPLWALALAIEIGYLHSRDFIISGPNCGGCSVAQYKALSKDHLDHNKFVVGRNGRWLIAHNTQR